MTGRSKAVRYKFPLIMLAAFILVSVHLAHAQQPKKVPRIGYLTTRSGPEAGEKAFLQGLQSFGAGSVSAHHGLYLQNTEERSDRASMEV